jgi:phosphoribosylformylglycinamidine cyclo-ligase
LGSWERPAVFRWLERVGAVPEEEMLRTFNMGLGLILVVAAADVEPVIGAMRAAGESGARVIGEIAAGSVQRVRYQS